MATVRAQLIRYAPGRVMPEHVDGTRRLSVLISGTLDERDADGGELATVGSVGLKDGRHAHESRFGEAGTTIVSTFLPNDIVPRFGVPAGELDAWRWHHGGGESLAGLSLAAALQGGDTATVGTCLSRLLASFSRSHRHPPPPDTLFEIRDRLIADPHVAPDVEQLAAERELHPVSLGRLFRRHFGCSITRFRQRVRVASAARALIDGCDDLSHVAVDFGYSDLSHMTRHFRRELGLPPGAFRARLQPLDDGLEPFKTEWTVSV